MILKKYFFILFFLLSTNSVLTSAATFNVDTIMTENAQPTINAMREQCRKSGKRLWFCAFIYRSPILFTDVTFSSGTVRTSNLNLSPFPESIDTKTFYRANCGPSIMAMSETWTTSISNDISTTTKDSVKTTQSAGVGVKFEVVNIEEKYQKEVSFENSETKIESTTSTHSLRIDKTLPAYTGLVVSQDFRKYRKSFDFDGDVYVDGKFPGEPFLYSKVMNGNNMITVRGSVVVEDHEVGSIIYKEVPIDPNNCQPIANIAKTLQRSNAGYKQQVTKNNELIDNYASIADLPFVPTQKTISVESSASFITANVVANVRARARNLGNSLCYSTIDIDHDQSIIFAPAQSWSDWATLKTHVGSEMIELSNLTTCSSPVEIELRYYE